MSSPVFELHLSLIYSARYLSKRKDINIFFVKQEMRHRFFCSLVLPIDIWALYGSQDVLITGTDWRHLICCNCYL